MTTELIELTSTDLPKIAEIFRAAFAGDPWNDDWSDTEQLYEYIREISGGYNALNYGLLVDGELVEVE